MNKKNIFIALLFTILIAVSIGTALGSNQITAENVNTPTQPTTEKYHTYIVREHNGMVAVFQQGEDKPFKITDTYVSSLPNADRQSLSNGIQVDTKEELRKLLEDLCS